MLSDQRTQSRSLIMATKLRKFWQKIGWGPLLELMAVVIVSMLLQRLKKTTADCKVPMQEIAVFPLVLFGKIHDVLRCSFYLAQKLSFVKNFIPPRKKSRQFHWIGLKFETGNLLGCKILLGHMGRKDVWHDLNQYLSRSDTGEVLMLGQL